MRRRDGRRRGSRSDRRGRRRYRAGGCRGGRRTRVRVDRFDRADLRIRRQAEAEQTLRGRPRCDGARRRGEAIRRRFVERRLVESDRARVGAGVELDAANEVGRLARFGGVAAARSTLAAEARRVRVVAERAVGCLLRLEVGDAFVQHLLPVGELDRLQRHERERRRIEVSVGVVGTAAGTERDPEPAVGALLLDEERDRVGRYTVVGVSQRHHGEGLADGVAVVDRFTALEVGETLVLEATGRAQRGPQIGFEVVTTQIRVVQFARLPRTAAPWPPRRLRSRLR